MSQSPLVDKAPKWKDVVNMSGASNLFENFEIALHGDFGTGIKGGELIPSKMELWQLLTGCGAMVYKSVNLFTFSSITSTEKVTGYLSVYVYMLS